MLRYAYVSSMQIDAVELLRLRLPMLAPFRSGAVQLTDRDLLLVRVEAHDDEGSETTGWGECSALSGSNYTSVDVDGALEVLQRDLIPALIRGGDHTASDPFAAAALDTALIDAELRAAGRSLAEALGAVRRRVLAGAAIGFTDSIESLVADASFLVESGYKRVKVKIAPGWDVEPLTALRARFGDDVAMQADANGAYTLDDHRHLARLDDLGLLCIEQPLSIDDLTGHAALAERIATPICLDESIVSLAATRAALEIEACSVVCVKPARLGGIERAVEVHDLCVEHGVGAWCGGMLETGVGRSTLLALAALPGFTFPGDLSATGRWYADDLLSPIALDGDGCLPVPDGPGIGPSPDRDAVDQFTTWRATIAVERS
jgi:o-succinylbenzoate synthase